MQRRADRESEVLAASTGGASVAMVEGWV